MKFKSVLIILFSLLYTICEAQKKELKKQDDGFQWYQIESGTGIFGAEDIFGKEIIPLNRYYTRIIYHTDEKYPHFMVAKGEMEGVCDLQGKEIISPQRGYRSICFHPTDESFGYFTVSKYGFLKGYVGVCDMKGREVIPCNYKDIIFHIYDKVLMYENHEGKLLSLDIRLDDRTIGEFSIPSLNQSEDTNNLPTTLERNNYKMDQVSNDENGINSKHGKIINRTSELQGTIRVVKEWYEDGYYSIFLLDKCKACGGTGKVGFNFCTAGCAMGFISLLTFYDPDGNVVEQSGTGWTQNNSHYESSSGGSYSSSGSSSSSSTYTKCTSCNGTGRCSSCNGRGYKFNSYSGHDDSCPSCRGKGSCPICYGRGKL